MSIMYLPSYLMALSPFTFPGADQRAEAAISDLATGPAREREDGYPNGPEAKEVTAAQIAAHSPSDKSNTAITDPRLLSCRLWAGFPSGWTVGRSSAGYEPPNRTLLSSISPTPRMCAHFL